jgi:hypothetical protein
MLSTTSSCDWSPRLSGRASEFFYKTLGRSFTGRLTVDPAHRRHVEVPAAASTEPSDLSVADSPGSDRARRVRDAVEVALSDIILLGPEEQVRLAARAAHELPTSKLAHTQELVISLRVFVREALDLDPIPSDLVIPLQNPSRPTASGGREKVDKAEGREGGGGGMDMGGGMSDGLGLDRDLTMKKVMRRRMVPTHPLITFSSALHSVALLTSPEKCASRHHWCRETDAPRTE